MPEDPAANTASTMQAASPAIPAHLQTFMALDFGTRRTGVAFGNRLMRTAQPLGTVRSESNADRIQQIQAHVREWQPQALVVGVPFHPDGAEHENTRLARKFARSLHGQLRLPVFEVDERYSTTEALAGGARDADAEAACIILAQFLRSIE